MGFEWKSPSLVMLISVFLCGCASTGTPERLYSVQEESADIRAGLKEFEPDFDSLTGKEARLARNKVIAARKYAIDLQYTTYEAALMRELQVADFGTKAANIALATTAEFVPVLHTKDMLTGIGLGMTNLEGAYSDKVLRTKMIENIQASMRAARHERAAVIFRSMRCSIKTYPLAMALSDLESYYRAGTFASGIIKLSHITAQEESTSAAGAEVAKSGNPEAQAKLNGIAAEAQAKAGADTSVNGKKTKVAHKCTSMDSGKDES